MTENLPDVNVGNIEYISREDAMSAVEFGITLASAINIETGEWTELFQRENDELRKAVERIKGIEPADVVPVVRCKDCKYNATTHKCLNPDSFFLIPKDDDFCSYGKHREE